MRKKLIGIFVCVLLTISVVPSVESTNNCNILSTAQGTDLLFGKIIDLKINDESIIFLSVNLKVFRFDTLLFNSYNLTSTFEISKEYKGVIGEHFIFALTKIIAINAPDIDCLIDSDSNSILIVYAQANIKWKNIKITPDHPNIAWRVFNGNFSNPIDGWNSTIHATRDVLAGDFIYLQFNQTTPHFIVTVALKYIPTNSLIGIWKVQV